MPSNHGTSKKQNWYRRVLYKTSLPHRFSLHLRLFAFPQVISEFDTKSFSTMFLCLSFTSSLPLHTRSFTGPGTHPVSFLEARSTRRRSVNRRSTITSQLIGIPDDMRSRRIEPSPHEVLLAEFRFTEPERLPALVENSLDLLDDEFYSFIESKVNETSDMEERETLRALRDAITDIMKQILKSASANYSSASGENNAVDTTSTTIESDSKSASNSSRSVQSSYDEIIDMFVSAFENSPDEETGQNAIKTAVDLNYHRIDMGMLERLSERIVAAGDRAPLLAHVRDEISFVMNQRVGAAMESVKSVLSAGSPDEMRSKVHDLSQRGKVDDAFILLLQANQEEARKAGVQQAVIAIGEILRYATEVQDETSEAEIRLIRKLLRTDNETVRVQILTDAITPEASVELPDGSKSTGMKIDGKKFVTALRKLIEDYGHIDESFVLKLSKIGEESEQVARKIFNMEDKDISEYQDEAFHKRSVSIWDLEEYEHQETMEGRSAPWEGKLGPIPEKMGFGPDGRLSV